MRTNRTLLLFPALLVLLALLVLAGCKDFSFYGVLGDRIDDTPLQIAPPAATLAAISGTLTFSASGGTPPYTYSVVPAGGTGTIVATTGAFTAGIAGGVTVVATDSKGRTSNASVMITTTGALAISPVSIGLSLGGGLTFVASGGTPPYTFTLTASGSGSPTINVPLIGDYVAGLTPGIDAIQVQDWVGATAATTVNVTAAPPTVDYSLTGFSIPSPVKGGSLVSGATFHVANGGIADGVEDIYYWVYLSDDGTLSSGDALLDADSTGALAMGPGTDVGINGTWPLSSGAKNLIVVISAADDRNVANNVGAAVPVTLRLPDYQGTLTHDTGATAGAGFTGTLTISNIVPEGGSEDLSWSVYASLGNTAIDAGDKLVGSGSIVGGLPASGSSGPLAIANTWPPVVGSYFLVAVLAAADEIDTTGNQPSDGPVAVAAAPAPPVDYLVTTVSSTGAALAGGPLAGEFYYRNNLTSNGSQPVHWIAYASTDATLTVGVDPVIDSGDVAALSGSTTSALPVGFSGAWPAGAGNRFLFVAVSAADDTNTANNSTSSAAVPVSLPPVDYLVTTVSSTGAALASGPLAGEFYYRNNGSSIGTQPVHWIAYVSTDATLTVGVDPVIDSGDVAALAGSTTSALPVGFSGVWPAGAGNRFLFVAVSAADDTNTANNSTSSAAVPVSLPPVDYLVTTVSSTGLTKAGGPLAGEFYYRNNLTSNGSQPVHWIAYVSTDATLDALDPVIDSGDVAALAGSTTSVFPVSFTGTWPAGAGDRFLFVAVSAADDTNTANNSTSSAAVAIGIVDYVVAVAHTGGTTAGAAFTGSLTISNNGGPYARDGAEDLYWIVYASLGDAVASPDDTVVDQGLDGGGLAAGVTLGPLPIGGTWPTAAGTYFLVAAISAGDDANGANDDAATAGIIVGAVDYTGSVTPGTGTTANRPFTASLTISNSGNRNGTVPVAWTAYASLGNTTIDAADKVVGSGTIAGLPASGNSGPLPINSSWPTAAGAYFLVVEVSAADDYLTGNNRFASGAVAVTSPNVDYTVLNVAYDPSAPSTTTPGAVVRGTFDYRNAGTDAGIQTVFWTAYASLNTSLDASDTYITSGTAGPLAELTTSAVPVNFSGNWPLDYGSYYLLIMVSEIEDVNGANNRVASPVTTTIGMYTGLLAENNHEPNNDYSGLTQVYDLGITMNPGMSIYVAGTMNNADIDDVLGVRSGTATILTANMSWAANRDVSLYIWEGSTPPPAGVRAVSITSTTSLSISWTAVPGEQYWIDVTNGAPPAFTPNNIGGYTIVVTAN